MRQGKEERVAEEGCRVGPCGLWASLRCLSPIRTHDPVRPWNRRVVSAEVGGQAGEDGHQGGRGSQSCGKRARAWRPLTVGPLAPSISTTVLHLHFLFTASFQAGIINSHRLVFRPSVSFLSACTFLP